MQHKPVDYQILQNIITPHAQRDIVFIFHNDYFGKEKKYNHSYSYAGELMKFTWSFTNNSQNQRIDFISGDNLTEMLILAKQIGFKCAVVQTPGHVIRNNFIHELNLMRQQEWLLIGHILEQDNYLTVHDQCFMLNLDKLETDDMEAGEAGSNLVPLYDRSTDSFHDGYTPTWVAFNEQYEHRQCHFGWRWIAKGLINSQVLPLNNATRNQKIHLYPENPGNYDGWYRKNTDSPLAKIIQGNDGNDDRTIHIYNNETVSPDLIRHQTQQDKFDNVMVLASGFYGMKMAKEFSPKKLVYYDILPKMLEVTQAVNTSWDGIQDPAIYVTDAHTFHNPNVIKLGLYDEGIFKDTADLQTYLPEFRTIDKEYHQVDIITNPQLFVDNIPKTGTTYIWLDSIYTYWHNLWMHRPSEISNSYEIILNGIQQADNDIWLHVKDPNGYIRIIHNRTHNETFARMMVASNWRTWS